MTDRRQALAPSGDEVPLPPRDLILLVGGERYAQVGERFASLFHELAGLAPHHRVLDVGCGSGRMAAPLTRYLDGSGSYEGFDIVPEAIEWCRENITSRYPRFRFQLADVANTRYHPEGSMRPEDYGFPYADGEFDFVFLTSVFTHMLPEGVGRYLSEIGRVLKPGGRMFATFYLLAPESLEAMEAGAARLTFEHDMGTHRVRQVEVPEGAVAYDDQFVRRALRDHDLELLEHHRGSWSGLKGAPTFQDIVIARR
jgi:SAM-dependent methyltransferase